MAETDAMSPISAEARPLRGGNARFGPAEPGESARIGRPGSAKSGSMADLRVVTCPFGYQTKLWPLTSRFIWYPVGYAGVFAVLPGNQVGSQFHRLPWSVWYWE
jgi:hypothetical protein